MSQVNQTATDVLIARIAQLEARVIKSEQRITTLEQSIKELIGLVRRTEENHAGNIAKALAGVFHKLSDDLTAVAEYKPAFDQYVFTPATEDTPEAIDISHEQADPTAPYTYVFYNGETKIENQLTRDLAAVADYKGLLPPGARGWFTLSVNTPEEG